MSADCSWRKTDYWTLRRISDNVRDVIGTLVTREKPVVLAVIETIAGFPPQEPPMQAAQPKRIESSDGQMYAKRSTRKPGSWGLRRAGDNNSLGSSAAIGKSLGTLFADETSVLAVLETLAEFHRRDAL